MIDPTDEHAYRLASIVASSDDAIVSKDLNGIVRSWNQAAERVFGYSAEEMIGQSIRRIIPADRQTEEDRVLESIRAGRRVDHFETVRMRRDGTLVPISLTVSPILDGSGRVIGASKIARDISDRKRAEEQAARVAERDAFLSQVTLALTRSLNHEHTLKTLAALLTPFLADFCAVDIVDEQGTLSRVAAVHAGASDSHVADLASIPEVWTGSPLHVLKAEEPSFIGDATAPGDRDAISADVVRSFGFTSYMCVPLIAHARAVGTLTLANTVSQRSFTREDLLLAEDVGARAALAVENALAHQQLQNVNRLKDEFLATLSHELRTPLNAVLGYSRMLQSGAIKGERISQALEVIDRNASALAQIVEDVLDVSSIVLGKARMKIAPTDVVSVVEDAVATVTPAVDAKGLTLRQELSRDVPMISADPNRLQQVVWNMLNNAVKFTPKGGNITVRVAHQNSHIDIEVSDTGIGFPPAFQPYVFERFRQADGGPTRPHGGLGLGLSIARHIVEMHGGTIDAMSDGEGKGATFKVRLPLAAVTETVKS